MRLPFFRQRTREAEPVSTPTPVRRRGRPVGSKDRQPRKRRDWWEIEEQRFIRSLAEKDPSAFQALMRRRLGLDGEDETIDVLKAKRLLEKLGFAVSAGEHAGSSDGAPGGFLRELADSNLGEALGSALGSVLAKAAAPSEPAPTPQPAAAAGVDGTAPVPPPTANPHVEALVAEIVQLAPAEAVGWLRAQRSDVARQIATALVQTPPDRLPELVDRLRPFAPRGADLLAGRIGWLQQLAEALRAAAANESPL